MKKERERLSMELSLKPFVNCLIHMEMIQWKKCSLKSFLTPTYIAMILMEIPYENMLQTTAVSVKMIHMIANLEIDCGSLNGSM
jgi:hypothetical protein